MNIIRVDKNDYNVIDCDDMPCVTKYFRSSDEELKFNTMHTAFKEYLLYDTGVFDSLFKHIFMMEKEHKIIRLCFKDDNLFCKMIYDYLILIKKLKFKTSITYNFEISSIGKSELGLSLTNATQIAVYKQKLKPTVNIDDYLIGYSFKKRKTYKYRSNKPIAYPIKYNGMYFDSVESFYKHYVYENKSLNLTEDEVMILGIKLKLEQYPVLYFKIIKFGGINMLENASHSIGSKRWTGVGVNSGFIKNLMIAFTSVKLLPKQKKFKKLIDVNKLITDDPVYLNTGIQTNVDEYNEYDVVGVKLINSDNKLFKQAKAVVKNIIIL
jgi:hypothetical protein